MPAANLGVSKSSMAISCRGLPLLLSVQASEVPDCRRILSIDEGRDIMNGLEGAEEEGGGMEMLALSACVSVVSGSAYRPFLLRLETSSEANERRWEALRDLGVNGGGRGDDCSESASIGSDAIAVLRLLASGAVAEWPFIVAAGCWSGARLLSRSNHYFSGDRTSSSTPQVGTFLKVVEDSCFQASGHLIRINRVLDPICVIGNDV